MEEKSSPSCMRFPTYTNQYNDFRLKTISSPNYSKSAVESE